MRNSLINLSLTFAVFAGGCNDDTSQNAAGGNAQSAQAMNRDRDAGSSLVSNVAFPDATRSLVDASGEPSGGAPGGGASANLGGQMGAGGASGNNTATRVDMGMVDVPEICTALPEPPDVPDLDPNVRCAQGNEPKRVQDVRAPNCRENRPEQEDVVVDEAIVTAIFPPKPGRAREWAFVVQDAAGGAYSGVWIYLRGTDFDRNLREGDVVRIEGERKEYFDLTEIVIDSGNGSYTRMGQGQVPAPVLVRDPAAIAGAPPEIPAGRLTEMLESVLVEVRNVRVTNTAPDCPIDYDMFALDGNLRIEDEVGLDYQAALGDVVERATGILHYSFGTNKIIPRSNDDLVTIVCGGLPTKCEVSECIVEEGAEETGELIISEIQDDPRGLDAEREYIELYNPGNSPVELAGWWLQNCGAKKSELQGTIPAGGYFVVARSDDGEINGGLSSDAELGEGVHLGNGQGAVLLFNSSRKLVDQVRYESIAPWPMRQPGQSLELIQLERDNANGSVWSAGRNDYGPGGKGTPGRGPQR